jgi:hypothetical protein
MAMALKLRPEILGSLRKPMMAATSATTEATANAGVLPLPNKASHGPAPRDTITYNFTNKIKKEHEDRIKEKNG